jgi:hypothetical protein
MALDDLELLAEAERRAQVPARWDRGVRTALSVLTHSARTDARLTASGVCAVREHIVVALVSRLLREDLQEIRPELFQTDLGAPLIVVGLPRSGTTLLHRLLALRPDSRTLRYWEVRNPVHGAGPDERLSWARRELNLLTLSGPEFAAKHVTRPDSPEECAFLFDSSLVSSTFGLRAPLYSYAQWYAEQDDAAPYDVYRAHLQILKADWPDTRLVLKAPAHTRSVAQLLRVLPEAVVVQIHRDPHQVVPSSSSLIASCHETMSDEVDRHRVGRETLRTLEEMVRRNQKDRSTLPANAIFDCYYSDLLYDPIGLIRRIWAHAGVSIDYDDERRLRSYLASHPQGQFGQHAYRMEDFGVSASEIEHRFADYVSEFPSVLDEAALGF